MEKMIKEVKISTDIFHNREYRLPYGINLGCEYHVWEVKLDSSYLVKEYIHSPRKMKVEEICNSRFSFIKWEGSDIPSLFSGARYITNANQLEDIINSKYNLNIYKR